MAWAMNMPVLTTTKSTMSASNMVRIDSEAPAVRRNSMRRHTVKRILLGAEFRLWNDVLMQHVERWRSYCLIQTPEPADLLRRALTPHRLCKT